MSKHKLVSTRSKGTFLRRSKTLQMPSILSYATHEARLRWDDESVAELPSDFTLKPSNHVAKIMVINRSTGELYGLVDPARGEYRVDVDKLANTQADSRFKSMHIVTPRETGNTILVWDSGQLVSTGPAPGATYIHTSTAITRLLHNYRNRWAPEFSGNGRMAVNEPMCGQFAFDVELFDTKEVIAEAGAHGSPFHMQFEPAVFAGARFREYHNEKACRTLYANGKFVITGMTSMRAAHASAKQLRDYLLSLRHKKRGPCVKPRLAGETVPTVGARRPNKRKSTGSDATPMKFERL